MKFNFALLFLLSSCAYFIEKIDTPLVSEETYEKNIPESQTYCPLDKKVSFALVGSTEESQQVFLQATQKIKGELDFLDRFALWSLFQLSVRPDQSSPTSRFQILIHRGEKSFYFDFFAEEGDKQYPYLYGIEWTLRKFGKRTTLEEYVNKFQRMGPLDLKVGKDFAKFLKDHKGSIQANTEMTPFYFRGNEILKEAETIPPLNLKNLISQYRKAEKNQKIIINTTLAPFVTESGQTGSCNYDFNLYDNSIFLIDKSIPSANLFGLSSTKEAFFASSSQKLNGIFSLHGSAIFKGESKVRSSAVCVIEKSDSKLWTFSNFSRDPGQHLFHLVKYGLVKSQSTEEVDRLIRHSRHLFLSEPVRLIIESHRSRPDQIQNLLKLNLPIYNADKLGNIWGFTQFKGASRFIIDDRNSGAFVCQ